MMTATNSEVCVCVCVCEGGRKRETTDSAINERAIEKKKGREEGERERKRE